MITVFCIAVTIVATVLLGRDMAGAIVEKARTREQWTIATELLFALIFLFLIYGNLLYQLTRFGYLSRLRKHNSEPYSTLDAIYRETRPPAVAMLIPSYKEELSVVRQSMLSCALQTYPKRHVVLLIDDPCQPSDVGDLVALERMRRLPTEIQASLEVPAALCRAAYQEFRSRALVATRCIEDELHRYQRLHLAIVGWFTEQAEAFPVKTHTDQLFVEVTFLERAGSERKRVARVTGELPQLRLKEALDRLNVEYCRLASLFDVRLTSFERKRYINLSHEPNKAMNLNSYIGIMGHRMHEVEANGQLSLEHTTESLNSLHFPAADFVLTLDADSLLVPDYTLRLLEVMKRDGNERLAVIQTPYSAVPNPPGGLERVAGATTDMQYLIHQGFSRWNATFWVGANAILRKSALDDIVTVGIERGFPVYRFIQDRTVIEDTESSIDLAEKGWSLHNYPERLSFSATPPDFGALSIQRRRWANGGLIILPKLLRYLRRKRWSFSGVGEAFMRLHYLVSIFAVNAGVLIILTYPFERDMRVVWLPLTAAPYYFLYGRDLIMAGYEITDLFRIYALNLILIPVNLAGVLKSLQQSITGEKIPFSRTPKITDTTPIPTAILASELILLLYCVLQSGIDGMHARWFHALFASLNACVFGYALSKFIGIDYCLLHFSASAEGTWSRLKGLLPETGSTSVVGE
jgi:cellulose synthase/poly-beta-1,6-N-acetylglucosamine synthase-like glycosyltransferase